MKSSLRKLKVMLMVLLIFNLFDLAATFWMLQSGYIQEQNPLMDWLYQLHPLIFVMVKLIFPSSCLVIIYYGCRKVLRDYLIHLLYIPSILYGVICGIHIYNLGILLFIWMFITSQQG